MDPRRLRRDCRFRCQYDLNEPCFVRRRRDDSVGYLLGKEPPAAYEIKRPEGGG